MNDQSFEDLFAWRDPNSEVFYGTDVLSGLVDGARAFANECRMPNDFRWRRTPALIASAMWIDDEPLLEALQDFYAVCVTIQMQRRSTAQLARRADISGLPIWAFPGLRWRRPAVDGQPQTIGPYDRPLDDLVIGPFRAFGVRRDGKQVPILHAKLALLGHTWWGEDDFGSEVQGFTPVRVWISSANFTSASRRSLEFGFWSEDPDLLRSTESFLERVMEHSEPVDPENSHWSPELLEPELDDDAFAEAAFESHRAFEEMEALDDEDG